MPLLLDDGIGVRRRRPVGPFAQNPALEPVGILRGDLVLGGGGKQNVAGLEQNFLRGHFRAAAREIRQRLSLVVNPLVQLCDIESLFVVKPAVNVRDADDFVAGFCIKSAASRADVAESLDDHTAVFALHAEFFDRLVAADHQPAPGGFLAALRAAKFERLARLPRQW